MRYNQNLIGKSPSIYYRSLFLSEHYNISQKLLKQVKKLSYNSLPIVGLNTKTIIEYPKPFPNAIISDLNSIDGTQRILDTLDPGHRHFSHLHWVYPGLFHPLTFKEIKNNNNQLNYQNITNNNIYLAAKNSMKLKRDNNGGHTGWSAAWESCLNARLGQHEHAWNSLTKILDKFITYRYLSFHPPTINTEFPNGKFVFN